MILAIIATAFALVAACTVSGGPTKEQVEKSKRVISTFINDAIRVYKVPIRLTLQPDLYGRDAAFVCPDRVAFGAAVIGSPVLEAIVAHEIGHLLLQHCSKSDPSQVPGMEIDANAKAVEVLIRVRQIREEEGLRRVLDYLVDTRQKIEAGKMSVASGHPPVCEQIDDLIRRFPQHAVWARREYGCR